MEGWLWLRAGIAVGMLAATAVLDLRSRRVPNHMWKPFVLLLAVAVLLDAATGRLWSDLVWYAAAGGSCLLVIGMWRTGLLFGGADAKALMLVALLVPVAPRDGMTTLALDSLMHGALLAGFVPLGLWAWNISKGRRGGFALAVARPVPIEEARRLQMWPLERVEDDAVVRRYTPGDDLDATLDALDRAGLEEAWISPRIPFLVPLAAGAALALACGNLVLRLVLALAG